MHVHAPLPCPDLQTDDLARMYRLFQRVPKGLEPVAEIFREHVEGEGNRLVKDVTEAMEDKRGKVGRGGRDRGR